ncbi:hypothetical protein BGZ63DRAFT_17178 [Mariannaea sp. PMI_226]|nr:hypothetical protein BGZ63DRAFT_17178 [Mariannaea sp. PMI_226]
MVFHVVARGIYPKRTSGEGKQTQTSNDPRSRGCVPNVTHSGLATPPCHAVAAMVVISHCCYRTVSSGFAQMEVRLWLEMTYQKLPKEGPSVDISVIIMKRRGDRGARPTERLHNLWVWVQTPHQALSPSVSLNWCDPVLGAETSGMGRIMRPEEGKLSTEKRNQSQVATSFIGGFSSPGAHRRGDPSIGAGHACTGSSILPK